MFKGEVLLGCAIVRIFRADMFECCQQRHLPFAGLQTVKETIGVGVNEKAALSSDKKTALSFTSISILPW